MNTQTQRLKKLSYWANKRITKPQRVKVSFWASKGSTWLDKRFEKLYNELLKISNDIDKLQDKIYELGTEPEVVHFRRFKKPKSYYVGGGEK
jgi:hypothetical protein